MECTQICRFGLSAEEALAADLVTEIGDFSPPKGTQLFYLGAPDLQKPQDCRGHRQCRPEGSTPVLPQQVSVVPIVD
jgi:hypothetical protein